ncbi:MAG: exopolysaccharide Pel transporter PelG [Bacteriovoracaceae bacterium]|nr:exopolysaccharide Pel transporter PelG [Bacteriovoracaceae bacterium]
MAGIGFRLEAFFSKKDVIGTMKGGLYALFISSGPWIISILTIALLSKVAYRHLSYRDLLLLQGIVSYTISFSLLFFGIIEMPLTRYLADRLYLKDEIVLRPLYLGVLTWGGVILCLMGYLFYSFFDFPFYFTVIILTFLFSIYAVWLSMIFLSAGKNYIHITWSFVLGGVSILLLGKYLGPKWHLEGYVTSLAIGYGLIAIMLGVQVFRDFPKKTYFPLDFFSYFSKYRPILFAGFFYYCAIWVDKYIFWYSHEGEHIYRFFYTHFNYNSAMFFSYITIIPSMAFFLVKVETDFFKKYLYYFTAVERKSDLYVLQGCVDEMVLSLRRTIISMIRMQVFVSVVIIYFTPEIFRILDLSFLMIPIFRYGVIGAFLQVLFMVANIIMLYFELYKEVFSHYLFFFLSNALFAFISLKLGSQYHGLGYTLSAFFTFVFSYYNLNKKIAMVNYRTFMGQPITHKNILETEDIKEG